MLARRLRFQLERAPGESSLIDRTGRTLKMEPLTTVGDLERYLLKMVRLCMRTDYTCGSLPSLKCKHYFHTTTFSNHRLCLTLGDLHSSVFFFFFDTHSKVLFLSFPQVAKQWYDHDRSTFNFVRLLKGGNKISFTHMQDFDENGILYWLGTNGKSTPDWVNPGSVGIVAVSTSEGRGLPYGKVEDILSRDAAALNCHTNDDKYVNGLSSQMFLAGYQKLSGFSAHRNPNPSVSCSF